MGTLAVFTFMTVFPPYFHGWGEVTETGIAGWAVNSAEPWERVEVQLFIDGQFIAQNGSKQVAGGCACSRLVERRMAWLLVSNRWIESR